MKKLNIAIVGTNFISDRFAEAVIESGSFELYAVFSRKLETGKAFADKYAIPNVYVDYSEMLSDDKLDAVYIASPTFCHKEQSVLAMKAGKHVLCEKMIALNYSEFAEMRSAAESFGVILLEAMRPDFDGAFDMIKNELPKLGKIRRISFDYCQYSSRYDSFKSGIVLNAFNPKLKNSALADIGIYPLHMCVSLFGEPLGITSSSIFLDNGFEGAGTVLMQYPDMLATVNYSKITDNISKSMIEGELGCICFDKFNAPKKISVKLRSGEEYDLPFEPKENNMTYEAEAFRDMITGKRSNKEYLDISERTMRCVEKIYESSGITASF